jgi:hypothetical protein
VTLSVNLNVTGWVFAIQNIVKKYINRGSLMLILVTLLELRCQITALTYKYFK